MMAAGSLFSGLRSVCVAIERDVPELQAAINAPHRHNREYDDFSEGIQVLSNLQKDIRDLKADMLATAAIITEGRVLAERVVETGEKLLDVQEKKIHDIQEYLSQYGYQPISKEQYSASAGDIESSSEYLVPATPIACRYSSDGEDRVPTMEDSGITYADREFVARLTSKYSSVKKPRNAAFKIPESTKTFNQGGFSFIPPTPMEFSNRDCVSEVPEAFSQVGCCVTPGMMGGVELPTETPTAFFNARNESNHDLYVPRVYDTPMSEAVYRTNKKHSGPIAMMNLGETNEVEFQSPAMRQQYDDFDTASRPAAAFHSQTTDRFQMSQSAQPRSLQAPPTPQLDDDDDALPAMPVMSDSVRDIMAKFGRPSIHIDPAPTLNQSSVNPVPVPAYTPAFIPAHAPAPAYTSAPACEYTGKNEHTSSADHEFMKPWPISKHHVLSSEENSPVAPTMQGVQKQTRLASDRDSIDELPEMPTMDFTKIKALTESIRLSSEPLPAKPHSGRLLGAGTSQSAVDLLLSANHAEEDKENIDLLTPRKMPTHDITTFIEFVGAAEYAALPDFVKRISLADINQGVEKINRIFVHKIAEHCEGNPLELYASDLAPEMGSQAVKLLMLMTRLKRLQSTRDGQETVYTLR